MNQKPLLATAAAAAPQRLPPHPLGAVLFDLDGTLVRTFIDFAKMKRELEALSVRRGTQTATAGETDVLMLVARMSAALGGGKTGAAAQREAYDLLGAIERDGCARAEPIPGARELLAALRERGVPVAIITRNARSVAQDLIRRFDLACDRLVAREDTPRFKPDPEPLLVALGAFGVAASASVMVGDYWPDVAAGRAAGAFTVGIQWPYDPPGRFAKCPPDVEVASLRAVRDLLFAQP